MKIAQFPPLASPKRALGIALATAALLGSGALVLLAMPGGTTTPTTQLSNTPTTAPAQARLGSVITPTGVPSTSTPTKKAGANHTAASDVPTDAPTADPTPTETPPIVSPTPTDTPPTPTPTEPPAPTATPGPSWHVIGVYSGDTTGFLAVIPNVQGPIRITWTCTLAKASDVWMLEFDLLNSAGAGSSCQYQHTGGVLNLDVDGLSGSGYGKDYTLNCVQASGAWNATVEEWY